MPTKGCSRKPPSMMLLALLCSLVAAPRAFASPLAGLQDLAPQNLPIGASLGGFEFDYSPNPEYDEKAHYKIVNLFKRGCTLPQGGVCSDGAACCNNPNASGKGWCCNSGKLCGDGKDETYCMQST
ncbi:hypothetical protein BU24DRAFT_200728 [Aaosphaeria arxii CBS 175.79]|uniref:Carbohydrate-binding module family 18 protein n=1 Tax=Aaosphaeria arxii CBS 175.79 TaxID=1450172 RepID=A0A6A5XTU2_9PLEO|nr:uncharacterized protein BU24DRAFT_200728 [Aaosphaeria arxii CBS 175.79]KAF2016373.1 hypothetical protein BU24DRAFT_200728 [Aaosphaeria arxii CBS 175.79]